MTVTTQRENPHLAVFNASISKAPRRTALERFYQRVHWTKMKASYNIVWARKNADYNATSEDERRSKNLEAPQAVQVRAEVAADFLKNETPEFMKELEREREADHQRELAMWKATQRPAQTPEEYHHQIEHAAEYIGPVAKSIAAHMGAAVSIFVMAPIAKCRGQVELRR